MERANSLEGFKHLLIVSASLRPLQERFKLGFRGLEPLGKGEHPACRVSYTFAPSIGDHRRFLALNTCRDDEHVQVKPGTLVPSPVSKGEPLGASRAQSNQPNPEIGTPRSYSMPGSVSPRITLSLFVVFYTQHTKGVPGRSMALCSGEEVLLIKNTPRTPKQPQTTPIPENIHKIPFI